MKSTTVIMGRFSAPAAMLCIVLVLSISGPRAWNASGHRTISCLALATADLQAVPWLAMAEVRQRILFHANQPDRLRSRPSPVLRHINEAEHYFEVDGLPHLGLTLHTVPALRRVYLRAIVLTEKLHGASEPADAAPQYLLAGPGFLAHGIAESRDLLVAALHEVRILEVLADPRRDHQLTQSRADAIQALGRLSHLVGDGSQPLHTTRHYNGWTGRNPQGYTRSRAFHRLVDSRPGSAESLSCAALLPGLQEEPTGLQGAATAAPAGRLAGTVWHEILTYLGMTHAQVEPLYILERDSRLQGPRGEAFIRARLLAGAMMLASMLQEAVAESKPTAADITRFVQQVQRPPLQEKPPAGNKPDRRHD